MPELKPAKLVPVELKPAKLGPEVPGPSADLPAPVPQDDDGGREQDKPE